MGMPRKNPPSHAAGEIISLASTGFSKRGIAAHFNISLPTLDGWFEEYPALKDAFERGREHERQALHNVLYKLAMEKQDKISAMFLLKSRHGYVEGEKTTESTPRLNITFNLPGALKPEDYKIGTLDDGLVIDGNASITTQQLPESTS